MTKRLKVLLLAAAGLGGLIAVDHVMAIGSQAPVPGKEATQSAPDETQPVADNPLKTLKLKQFSAISKRPLFAEDRNPPAKGHKRKKAKQKKPAPKKRKQVARVDHLQLLGVSLSGPNSIALIRNKRSGRASKVRLEDVIAGWEVAAIEPALVELVNGDKSVLLELHAR